MTASILFGLLSALFYGVTDFLAKQSGSAAGPLRTILYGHTAAAIGFSLLVIRNGIPAAPTETCLWTILSIASNLAATALLYTALRAGSLSVVAPIAASYGGVSAVLAAMAGEYLAPLGWAGLFLTLCGGLALTRAGHAGPQAGSGGLWHATAAALLYGLGFWVQGELVIPSLGVIVPTWAYYVSGALASLIVVWKARVPLRLPARHLPLVFGTTAAAVAGTLMLALGQAAGHVAIATVMSGLASGVSVVIGSLLLREPLSRLGIAGVFGLLAGLALLHAA
ncbi:DMT family transporter [Sphingosinicella sp. CPCC 101087]|uniref:DMT family transporter n=1 Tax=Sphingosinicella sp. CPCC 101087 TaxID=2497754 RepID=UPI00101D45CE|nr:DMT family transporter [Sphingosinicella sp. CPCC 101087]